MTPDDDDVRALMAETCEAVLGLEVSPAPGEVAPSLAPYLCGRVVVSGAWEAAVILACTTDFARQAAERIFEAGADATSIEDVRDALGELTNIIGGGVKGLMPSPSRLSLPTVSEAAGWRDGEAGAGPGPAREVWFSCSGQRFVVTITLTPAAEPAPRSEVNPHEDSHCRR